MQQKSEFRRSGFYGKAVSILAVRRLLHPLVLCGVFCTAVCGPWVPYSLALPLTGQDVEAPLLPARSGVVPGGIEVDRIVAVVDEDPIFASDIERLIALGLVEAEVGETPLQLRRRVLSALIDQRLHLHVVERFDFGASPSAAVERQLVSLRQQLDGPETFADQLQRLGLDEASLRLLLARQLRILIYIEERLGPKVFVDQEDVEGYYEDTLLPAMAEQGVDPVPFDEVRDDIRALLREQRLNSEIERWTEELRLRAEIINLFDRSARPLPPVVDRLPADRRAPSNARGW